MQILRNVDIIGIISFLIAAYTFYRTQLKKGKVEIVAGPSIDVYYAPNGGSCFYIPMAFINENDNSGKVIDVSFKNICPNKQMFKMRWADFVNYDAKNRGYIHLDRARAFSVPGQSVIDKFVWFDWRPTNQKKLEFEIGKYVCEIILDSSTRKSSRLLAFPLEFEIGNEDYEYLLSERERGTTGTRSIILKNFEPENTYI